MAQTLAFLKEMPKAAGKLAGRMTAYQKVERKTHFESVIPVLKSLKADPFTIYRFDASTLGEMLALTRLLAAVRQALAKETSAAVEERSKE